jgi:hypothetical protein
MVDHSGTAPESATPFCQGIKLQYKTLYCKDIYLSNRADPPPRFENVETSKTPTGTQRPQPRCQWQSCNLVPCYLKCSQQVGYQQRSKSHSQHSQSTNLALILFRSAEFFPIFVLHCSSLCSVNHMIPYTTTTDKKANKINHMINCTL